MYKGGGPGYKAARERAMTSDDRNQRPQLVPPRIGKPKRGKRPKVPRTVSPLMPRPPKPPKGPSPASAFKPVEKSAAPGGAAQARGPGFIHQPNMPKDGDRVAKIIARAGLGSRREAEQWIKMGRVTVNGAKISWPGWMATPSDTIHVDGSPVPQRERTRLFLFHKPAGTITTSNDPQKRPTIWKILNKRKDLPRLISIGRLDINSEGLLLLTNDGGLARVLELPATGWLRRYRVRAHGEVTQAELDKLRSGIEVDGIRYGMIEATLERQQGANVWITFAMREGKNREIKNVLGALGLQVNRLIRVSFGPFQLGELAEGGITEVRTKMLRDQLGPRLAAAAGADFSSPLSMREPPPEKGRPNRVHVWHSRDLWREKGKPGAKR